MTDPTGYPGIERATLLIAIDNGGINRDRSKAQQRRDLAKFLRHQPDEILKPVDDWLVTLSEEELDALCCGGRGEPETDAILDKAPPFADHLLNLYFDEVC
jgi:hypothetical protein